MLPIHQLSLPTPWASVGPIHTYVIRQDPVTLIDAGLSTPESREALGAGLAALGLKVTDIRRVLLTHAHLDHFGLAAWVAEQSGAEIYLHPDEVGKAETPEWWRLGRDRTLAEAGVPLETRELMDRYFWAGRRMVVPLAHWLPLADGQRFAFERGSLEAIHLPGHALGHTGFLDREGGTLVGGDHLLDQVTPNPILEPVRPGHPAAVEHDPIRALTLGQFLGALERVSALELRRVLPGHGPVVEEYRALAAAYTGKHERRLTSLLERLGDGQSAWALTRTIYPRVREFDIFLALSEVLAHLDLLVVRGRARFERVDGLSVYRPV